MQEFLNNALLIPLGNLVQQIYLFVPNLFAMILILIIGFFISFGIKLLLNVLLKIIRFDKMSDRLGFSNGLNKAGIRLKPSEFLIKIIYWMLFIIFIMLALNALRIEALDTLITQFFLFLPNVITGLILLFVGYFISTFLARTVLIAAVNAEIAFAKLISRGVQVLVLLFFLAITLEQIGIGENIVIASFSIIFGGMVLALALALGLGGRELGKDWLEKQFGKKSGKEEEKDKNMWSHL
jgi:hypothetical protein